MIARRTIYPAAKIDYSTAPSPPSALDELRQLDQWVISKPVESIDKNGNVKFDKPPFSPHTRRQCSHSNPADWASYQTALGALPGFSWLGFAIHESDPYTGIDLDGCRDPQTGIIELWAQRIIDLCASYTEISPSGTGVKIWVRGTVAKSLKKSFGPHKGIEVYSKQRYFTFTGMRLAETPDSINNAQFALDALVTEYAPAAPAPAPARAAIAPRAQRHGSSAPTIPDVITVLLDAGAIQTSDKDFTCPYCAHSHKNTLFVFKGRVYSRSSGCIIPEKGGLDTVGLHAVVDYGSNTEANRNAALKAHYPIQHAPRAQQQAAPAPAHVRYTDEQRVAYNAARQAQRHDATMRDLEAICEAACAIDMSDRARSLFSYLATSCHERGVLQIAPTNAQLSADLDMCERYVQYAFRDLEQLGLGKRQGGKGGLGQPNEAATWTFYRSPHLGRKAHQEAECTLSIHEHDLIHESLELVSGAQFPERENTHAITLDDWQWSADDHSAFELNALDETCEIPQQRSEHADAQHAECATYTPVAPPSHKPYTAITKHTADIEARYALVWETMRRIECSDDSDLAETTNFVDIPESEPLVRSAPSDPKLASEYWALKNKKAKSPEQARWMRRRIAELEVFVPLSEHTAPDTRPLTSYPARKPVNTTSQQQAFI